MLHIGGGTILQHSAAAFLQHPQVSQVVLVLPLEFMDVAIPFARDARQQPPDVCLVPGGARRQDSVANGFDAVDAAAEVVLIHDAARPFVSADLITRTIESAAAHGAAIAAVQSRDTVKRVAGGVIAETIPRESVYLRRPAWVRRDVLAAAIAAGRSGPDVTDEAAWLTRGTRVMSSTGILET